MSNIYIAAENTPDLANQDPTKNFFIWDWGNSDNYSDNSGIYFDFAYSKQGNAYKDYGNMYSNTEFNKLWSHNGYDKLPVENRICFVWATIPEKGTEGKDPDQHCIWFEGKERKDKHQLDGGITAPPTRLQPFPLILHGFYPSFGWVPIDLLDHANNNLGNFQFFKEDLGPLNGPNSKDVMALNLDNVAVLHDFHPGGDTSLTKQAVKDAIISNGKIILNFVKWSSIYINPDKFDVDGNVYSCGLKDDMSFDSNNPTNLDENHLYTNAANNIVDMKDVYKDIRIMASGDGAGASLGETSMIKMYRRDHIGAQGFRKSERESENRNKSQSFSKEPGDSNWKALSLEDANGNVQFPLFELDDAPYPGTSYVSGSLTINSVGIITLDIEVKRPSGPGLPFSMVSAWKSNGLASGVTGAQPFFPTFILREMPGHPNFREVVLKINSNMTDKIQENYYNMFLQMYTKKDAQIDDISKILYSGFSNLPEGPSSDNGVSFIDANPDITFVFQPKDNLTPNSNENLPFHNGLPTYASIASGDSSFIGWVSHVHGNYSYMFFIAHFNYADLASSNAWLSMVNDNDNVSTDDLFSFWTLTAMKDANDNFGNIFDMDELEINTLQVIEETTWVVPTDVVLSVLNPECYEKPAGNSLITHVRISDPKFCKNSLMGDLTSFDKSLERTVPDRYLP